MEPLSESLDRREFGGKAAGLALLIRLGFDVPAGFVIAADEPLDEARVWAAANKWTSGLTGARTTRLAVRSSAPVEDAADSSHAGQFLSLIGTFSCRELTDAIGAVRASAQHTPIPVVVQTVVEAEFSGVAFSCDPVELRRGHSVVSWVAGPGAALVSGSATGTTILVATEDPQSPSWPGGERALSALVEGLTRIEGALGVPADVEWALDATGRLWMLQARPVVLPRPEVVDGNSNEALTNMPSAVAAHPKVQLRRAAACRGVRMSNAVVVTASASSPYPALPENVPSEEAAALSIVLLHPRRLDDKVHREFAQVDRTDVPLFTLGCRRYSIRRYPSPDAASGVLDDVLTRGLNACWTASAVVQEIYDAEATGIVRRLGDDFVVELARGHFVPKGVVDPTRFVISRGAEVLSVDRRSQTVVYHFINGHVVTEQPAERPLDLTDAEIVDATMQISPLFLDYPDAALEFGVLKRRGKVMAYVIDVAEADSAAAAAALTPDLIATGVVSPGHAVGRAARVRNADQADLDSHLLSRFEPGGTTEAEGVIVFADRASVDLLSLANRLGPGSGFVFRHGSLLAHLSVVLRERGIPAVVVDDDLAFGSVAEGRSVRVNASDPLAHGHDRVALVDE